MRRGYDIAGLVVAITLVGLEIAPIVTAAFGVMLVPTAVAVHKGWYTTQLPGWMYAHTVSYVSRYIDTRLRTRPDT